MINKNQLRPFEFPGLIHCGNKKSDGGYVVPLRYVEQADVLLSLGLALEWTFDAEFKVRNDDVRIIGVDHSISSRVILQKLARYHFKVAYYTMMRNAKKIAQYQKLLATYHLYWVLFSSPSMHVKKMVTAKDGPGTVSFDTLMQIAGPAREHGVFLKMDIEGSEYDVIPSIVAHEKSISVVTAEFHDLENGSEVFNRGIEQLLQAFEIVHIHGNNCGSYSAADDFPAVVEITFVNKALFGEPPVPSQHSYPRVGLDIPNSFGIDDYPLRF